MIPTLLLVGLVIGAFIHDRTSLLRSAAIGAAASTCWGIGVGMSNGSIATFVGGVALALANVLVGSALSGCLRGLGRQAVGTRDPTSH